MPIRVGIAGAGRTGKWHIERLQKIEDVEITSICDIVKENAERLTYGLKINVYSDFQEMINKEKLDAIWICTPADVHSGEVMSCLEENIPFFLEKPVTINLEEGEKVAEKVKDKGILHSIGYMMRYLSVIEKLKKILSQEKLVFVSAQYFWTIPLVNSVKSKEKSGGQVIDQATHLIDLMRYLVGEIKTIYSRRVRGLFPEEKLYTGDDASATVFEFEHGVVGNLVCTYALFPEIEKAYPRGMLFICKKKLIEYKTYVTFAANASIHIITSDKFETIEPAEDAYLLEDEAFIQAIKRNNPFLIKSNYADAFQTIKVCLGVNKSMEKGEIEL